MKQIYGDGKQGLENYLVSTVSGYNEENSQGQWKVRKKLLSDVARVSLSNVKSLWK